MKIFLKGFNEAFSELCVCVWGYFEFSLIPIIMSLQGQDRCKAITGGVLALEAILKKWYKKNGTLTDDKLFATIHNVHTLQVSSFSW